MSRPDRPFRATRVLANRTVHHDYATKEERDAATCTEDKRTTVTSRKPVKPGTPVCWVNFYPVGCGVSPGVHRTKEEAEQGQAPGRTHCIPVYLPGEGAEPVTEQMREAAVSYYMQGVKDRQRIGELEAEVERLKTALTETMAQRDAAQAEVEQWKDAAEHAEGKLSEERMSSQAERKECDKLQAEVDRLTGELAAAQAQTMPAGKVVYGASGKFGINRDFQTIEFADKRLRDTYRKTDGWTWFTRVEES